MFDLFLSGIVVNGHVVGKESEDKSNSLTNPQRQEEHPASSHMRTYFGEISILYRGGAILVSPSYIRINKKTLKWRTSQYLSTGGATIEVVAKKNVTVSLGEGLTFVVLRHKVHKPHPTKVDFLGFYVEDGSRLSKKTHGLIGTFLFYMKNSPENVTTVLCFC